MELLLLLGLVGVAGAFVGLIGDDDPEPEADPIPEEDPDGPDFFSINGSPRAEELEGTDASDEIEARGGDDLVHGYGGDDVLRGSSGEDTLEGGDGNDTIEGGRGDDRMEGGDGDDSLVGGDGDDRLFGDSGDDTLLGGAGDDVLLGREGNNSLDGGDGDDTLNGLIGQNTLSGGDGDDRIRAANAPNGNVPVLLTNLIDGGSGNDTISFSGDSTVSGGSGADRLLLEADMRGGVTSRFEDFDPDEDTLQIRVLTQGSDGDGFTLIPREDGLGNDLYLDDDLIVELLSPKEFTLADIEISVDLLQTPDGVSTYTVGPNDAGAGISFDGSSGDDSITGNSGDDLLRGDSGSDTIIAGDGNDTLNGENGLDVLRGGAGNDTLVADANSTGVTIDGIWGREFENDTIDGGDGDDLLIARGGHTATGGAGSDVFGIVPIPVDPRFEEQSPPTIITDFNPAEDHVVIGPAYANAPPSPSDITVRVLDDGSGAEVLVGGRVAAIVYGGQDLTADDIQIGDANFTGDYRSP